MVSVLSSVCVLLAAVQVSSSLLEGSRTCQNVTIDADYDPRSPLVLCCLVPEEFYECEAPRSSNDTETGEEVGVCAEFGGLYYDDVETTTVNCTVLEGVRCSGERSFLKEGVPCVRYAGHFFPSIVLYSVFLGFLGVDRFCLGYTCLGVAKLLTLGAIGVWWVVDVILLLAGQINPDNGFNWEQFY